MNEELFEYFTTDNISGKKCTDKWLSKNNNELYTKIIEWCNLYDILKDLTFKQKVYHYVNVLTIIPCCTHCKKENMKYGRFRDGYHTFCNNKCVKASDSYKEKWLKSWKENNSNNEYLIKKNETIIKKYGSYENYNQHVLERIEESLLKNKGVKHYFLTDEFKQKRKQSLNDRYGDDKYNNKEKTKNTRISNGTQIDDSKILYMKEYRKVAINLSITVYRNFKKNVNPLNLKRGKKFYHIDHRFSLKQGFLINLPLEIISHPCNLNMLWYMDNLKKQDVCSISLEDLLNDIINYENIDCLNVLNNDKINIILDKLLNNKKKNKK